MAHFITSVDITDAALSQLVTPNYLTKTDQDVAALARMRGITEDQIERDPLDHLLRELAIAYCCKRICIDKMGINPQAYGMGVEVDIYASKLKHYKAEIDRLEPIITAEVLTGKADTAEEYSSSVELFRG